jgi:hypothetical protein
MLCCLQADAWYANLRRSQQEMLSMSSDINGVRLPAWDESSSTVSGQNLPAQLSLALCLS